MQSRTMEEVTGLKAVPSRLQGESAPAGWSPEPAATSAVPPVQGYTISIRIFHVIGLV